MLFSEPILEEQVVIFGKAETLVERKKWPEDFLGLRAGMNSGFSLTALGGDRFAQACRSGEIDLQEVNSTEQNLKKLSLGRIHFYLNDRLTDIGKFPSVQRGMVTASNNGHLGFTRVDGDYPYLQDFKKSFAATIREMKDPGEIDRIVKDYLK